MNPYHSILFDLDGTLTDSMPGITKSVQYALKELGVIENDLEHLRVFIGPPLFHAFRTYYGFSEEKAHLAVSKYREYYRVHGIFDNRVYDGIEDLLGSLAGKKHIMLATSKPAPFARQILDHFGLTQYFEFIGGSEFDGTRQEKEDVIRYVLEENHLTDPSTVLMVGDRKNDLLGAQANHIDSVGVLYGYGDRKELTQHHATYIVETVAALKEFLNR